MSETLQGIGEANPSAVGNPKKTFTLQTAGRFGRPGQEYFNVKLFPGRKDGRETGEIVGIGCPTSHPQRSDTLPGQTPIEHWEKEQ